MMTNTELDKLEARAIRLLNRYDLRTQRLKLLERDLAQAAREYGAAKGCKAYSVTHLRTDVHNVRRFTERTSQDS